MDEKEKKKGGVFTLSERETTHVVVGLLLGGFLLFVSGYYLGKRRACEEFAFGDDVQFAQKVHSALNSLAGRTGDAADAEATEAEAAEAEADEQAEGEVEGDAAKGSVQAYAHLCGFGSRGAAQAYVKRLTARHVGAHIAERTSVSNQGRRVTWYQVVTDAMDRAELCKVVAEIKKCDKLTDVSIIDLVE
ncbi:MAG: hypothetical protein M1549_01105 [Candidatus Dependentiae bacterium]|nr:hypothetical protein [Candidatus Dependentiae bacterium]